LTHINARRAELSDVVSSNTPIGGGLVMTTIDLYQARLSRRMILRGAAAIAAGGVAFGAAIAASAADAPAKKPQKSVAYQTTPKGSARCIACDQFLQPNACKTVDGVINPTGWCNLYSPKW
jgi:secreted PhoX family phosphatase